MILITGASGLIGRAVCRQLLESGERIRSHVRSAGRASNVFPVGFDNLRAAAQLRAREHGQATQTETRMETVSLEFRTATQSEFDQLVDGCHTIIHTAGLVHAPKAGRDLFERLNSDATSKLVTAANRAGVKAFVLFSTSAVYGGAFENITESAALEPLTPYAASKIASENSVRHLCSAGTRIILRPSIVFGEGDRGNMLALIRQIKKGRYVNIAGNSASKSVISAADAAYAVRLCLKNLTTGLHVLNLANEMPVDVNELSALIAAVLGQRAPLAVPMPLLLAAATVAESILRNKSPLTKERLSKLSTSTTLDVSALVQQTGFAAQCTLKQSLVQEVMWARGYGLLD
jgi:nucleoside-diphosphate-sugar epimerase